MAPPCLRASVVQPLPCQPGRFDYPSRRMIRVLHLLDAGPDYQTETGARQLAGDTSGTSAVEARTIGRGGTYANPFVALLHLRRNREIDRFDLVHAWGGRALTV